MKNKNLKSLKLNVLNEGRISNDKMSAINGGSETCKEWSLCGVSASGKNECLIYRNCSWFLNKDYCGLKYWAL